MIMGEERVSRTDFAWAVVFLARLAKLALEARVDCRTDPDAISNLDGGHLTADLDGFADDLVPDTHWQRAASPPTSDSVHIRTADPTGIDLDVDVPVFEFLRGEL